MRLTHETAFIPEIVTDDVRLARPALKCAALYFPEVRFQPVAMGLRGQGQMKLTSQEDGKLDIGLIFDLSYPEYREYLAEIEILAQCGAVTIVEPDLQHAAAEFQSWMKAFPLASVLKKVANDQKMTGWLVLFGLQAALLLSAKGLGTTPSSQVHHLYSVVHRRLIASDWSDTNKDRQAMVRRDAAAFSILRQLPDVSNLPYEEILELRQAHQSNLIRLRTYISELVRDSDAVPQGPDFADFTRRIVQDKLQPALVDLELELSHTKQARRWGIGLGLASVGFGIAYRFGVDVSALPGVSLPLSTMALTLASAIGAVHKEALGELRAILQSEQARAQAQQKKALSFLLDLSRVRTP